MTGRKIKYKRTSDLEVLDMSTIVLNDKKYIIDERDVNEKFKNRHSR